MRAFSARTSALTLSLLVALTITGCSVPAETEAASTAMGPSASVQATAPRNVILFISDGCGPASFTLAREFRRYEAEAGVAERGRDRGADHGAERGGRPQALLAVDGIQTGSVHTYSTSSRVTDSAAGATAFACGVKTYNGAIAMDSLARPVATLLEAAEAQGRATGLVTTTRITHATPAAFSAHVSDRGMEDEIALQQLAQGVDVLFGGGRRHFLPETDGGVRTDGRDLMVEASEAGYQIATTRSDLGSVQAPALGLFTMSDLPYEIDRDADAVPSLAEMTARAIELLSEDADGFFLMVEGGRIDHAGHGNDIAGHLHDVLAFDDAVAAALRFARENGETLVVSTSDHETGGLTLGRNVQQRSVYAWEPAVVAAVRSSHDVLSERLRQATLTPEAVLEEYAGIDDPTEDELAMFEGLRSGGRNVGPFVGAVAEVIDRRAVVGWTSGGHTAVDVNLYAFGPGSHLFVGHFDNTYIGRALGELMSADLAAMSRELQAAR